MTTNHPYPRQVQYQITPADYSALRTRLSAAAVEKGGAGTVHSLFFTSYRNRIPSHPIQEFHDGGERDARFALHYFDNDPTYLMLERWLDQESTRAMVTEAECRALLSGETDWLLDRRNPVLQDFHGCLTEQMLLPQVLLSYHREVYALDGWDLWVALDTDIHASLQHMDFLDPELLARDALGQTGRILMEISYSDTIPDDLLCLLEETAPRRKLLGNRLLT